MQSAEVAKPLVWIVDDDASIRWVLETALSEAGFEVEQFESPETPLQKLRQRAPAVILTDADMPFMDGFGFVEAVRRKNPRLPVIMMTAYADLDAAVSAYDRKVFEFVPKPFELEEIIALVRRAAQRSGVRRRKRRPRGGSTRTGAESFNLIGQAPRMQEMFRIIGRVARTDVTVLINGETGTGKELVAQALHTLSRRKDGPFVALNMAAIPKDLLESELFGHERGAFTGALERRIGRFEQAHGGTLFLDEIGDMPVELQTRLLRVLNDGMFYRVGGREPVRVDVRILAATHQDMEKLVKAGRFREDLLYRLNVIRIHVPPLRERREDIPSLMRHYLAEAARKLQMEEKILDPTVERYLVSLPWPGNVRQLASLCTWLTVMAPDRVVYLSDLPRELKDSTPPDRRAEEWTDALAQWARERIAAGGDDIADDAISQAERTLIQAALEATGHRRQKAARLLGWGRNTLTRKMQALKIS